MDSHELAKLLLSKKNLPVMFKDPNTDGGPFEVTNAVGKRAGAGEFPEEFNMPKGFKYILLET